MLLSPSDSCSFLRIFCTLWRVGGLPRPVGIVAVAGSACLIIVYLGRLIALDPNTAAIKPFAILYGLMLTGVLWRLIGPPYLFLMRLLTLPGAALAG